MFCILFFSIIGWLLGYDGLILVGEITVAPWVEYICGFLFFSINFIVFAAVILNEYTKKLFLKVIPYLLIFFIVSEFIPIEISTFIIPSIYFLVWLIVKKDVKPGLWRLTKVYLFSAIMQILMLVIKTGMVNVGYNMISFYQNIIFCIDHALFLIILYCMGGEKYHALELAVYTEEVSCIDQDNESIEVNERWSKLDGLRRIKAISLLFAFQIGQWLLILLVCCLGNVLLEGIIITIAFVAYGMIIKKRWHSSSILVCTISSSFMFFVAAKLVPSFGYSQLFPILIGFVMVYALYKVGMYTEKREKTENKLKELHEKMKIDCE